MSGISYSMPRFQAIDAGGKPMVGATLYTYKNKTTSPAPTWRDKEQSAYNTNPIVLDGRGEAVIWLDPEQVYTFVLRDWAGTLVWAQNDVQPQLSITKLNEVVDQKINTHDRSSIAHPELSAFISQEAKKAQESARNAATSEEVSTTANRIFATPSLGLTETPEGQYFWVVASAENGVLDLYKASNGIAVNTGKSMLSAKALLISTGKNLFDKSTSVAGQYISPSSKTITLSAAYRRSGYIPVIAGKSYVVSGVSSTTSATIGWFSDLGKATAISTSNQSGVAPTGARYAVFNITHTGQNDTAYDGTAQFEGGLVPTNYEPYKRLVPGAMIENFDDKLNRADILAEQSYNLINPENVDLVRRYSTGNMAIVQDALPIAASDWVAVTEGEWYTLSGTARFHDGNTLGQGGYFTEKGSLVAIQNIAWVSPVAGSGAAFQVPVGLGITHVVVSLNKKDGALNGYAQLERGEMPTAYKPYQLKSVIREDLLPTNPPNNNGKLNDALWFEYFKSDGVSLGYLFPIFRKQWVSKNKDLCVVNTGTSLTARSIEHCTDHPSAAFRPPLMHSNNLVSLLWDKIKWDGQHYRRYDSGFFNESTGNWLTASNLTQWDDGPYRSGLTRCNETPGSFISFTIPENAWQVNFIYRTDLLGNTSNSIHVSEGPGVLEVFNEEQRIWVEANGYVFSMREPDPTPRFIAIPSPATNNFTSLNIPSKGNTTYQKRLKMRTVTRGASKDITIKSGSDGRFMYWGIEWSERQYMITFINAARGSHNTQATGVTGLPRYQDNEVWSFKPDLLFFELPIHNDGAAGAGSYAPEYWGNLTNNFVFRADYELSLKSRGKKFGLNPEIGMFTSSITWNFGGISDNGSLKFGPELQTGKMMTALDKFTEAAQWVWEHHPDVPCINTAAHWCEAGTAIFGDMRSATIGSGKAGATFTNEGSHWNDTGCKVIAKKLLPFLDFTN